MLPSERVQGKDGQSVRPLAESIEGDAGFGVRKRSGEVTLRERRVGRVETGTEDASLVATAQVLRPKRVRLVFEHFAPNERQRLLERLTSDSRRLACGSLEQLVETVEIEVDRIAGEAVGLRLGDDELPCAGAVGNKAAAQNGNERLNRRRDVVRALGIPDQVRDPVDGDLVPA